MKVFKCPYQMIKYPCCLTETQRMPQVQPELLIHLEHLNSLQVFKCIRAAQYLVFFVLFFVFAFFLVIALSVLIRFTTSDHSLDTFNTSLKKNCFITNVLYP